MVEQLVMVISIIIFLVIGFFIKKGKLNTIGEFSISRSKLKWFPIAAGISMTYAGGAALLNMSSLGYSFGLYPLVDPISLNIGILTGKHFAEAIHKIEKNYPIKSLLRYEGFPVFHAVQKSINSVSNIVQEVF